MKKRNEIKWERRNWANKGKKCVKYRKYGKEGISKSKLEVGIHSRYSKGTEEFDKITKKGGNGR